MPYHIDRYSFESLIDSVICFSSTRATMMTIQLLEKLRRLNLFVKPGTQNSDDIQLVRDQILTTRLYIVLFTAAILVITLFTVLRPISVTETVSKPSLDTYLKLEAAHESTLSCLCSQPTVQYTHFFLLEAVFHEVNVRKRLTRFARCHHASDLAPFPNFSRCVQVI